MHSKDLLCVIPTLETPFVLEVQLKFYLFEKSLEKTESNLLSVIFCSLGGHKPYDHSLSGCFQTEVGWDWALRALPIV